MNVYSGKQPDGFSFFIRRFARLYPPHFITLVVVALLQFVAVASLGHSIIYHDNDVWNFGLHLFMASEWGLQHGQSFNYPIWSVSAEVLIYAVFWAFVRYMPLNLILLLFIWLAFQLLALLPGSGLIILCGVYFFGGAIAYSVYRLWDDQRQGLLLLFGAFGLAASVGLGFGGRYVDVPLTAWLLPAICSVLLLLVAAENLWLSKFFRRTRSVGDITYSSYLWHSPLQILILLGAGWGLWSVDSLFNDTFFAFYLALVCLVSFLSFQCIERPAQRWVLARYDPAMVRKPLIAAP
jgi:peptidoglycan/LPS O-acetylase OafA/YrhL